jgi:alanyl-tRNA synthetase
MKTDKELKKWFKTVTSKNPEKYYATEVLKREGFVRKKCSCGLWFWTVNKEQTVCGDPACQGGTRVEEKNPAKIKLSFIDVWKQFEKMFSDWGYKSVKRYPVVSRWNPTTDFTMASIAAFQPYVISGEVEPPAKKLVIPQFCLRFVDVDNVGITGAHCTGFVMIGQHMFVPPKEWDQNKAFEDILSYITKGVGLPKSELTLHEDAWAGGGNYGSCMEFFSRGVELFNQVYMIYEHRDKGDVELQIKVLDMGLGMERVAWFSQGAPNIYEATFPKVLENLKKATGVKYDSELFKKFSPYSALLNIDEVEDINKAWEAVGKKVGIKGEELKRKIMPMTAIYSIAEHTRSLLVAINDGALPSNVGGGYNLRVILRRALGFIDQFGWNIKLRDVAAWHASELKELFPELSENLEEVGKILDVETEKYHTTRQKARQIVEKIIHKEITKKILLELYDSNGISPEMVKAEAAKAGKIIIVPDNFYSLVAEMHEKGEKKELATKRADEMDLSGITDTEILYWGSYKLADFSAVIIKAVGNKVVLDKTAFYPTSGGQLHDTGKLNGLKVLDVYKQGAHVVHVIDGELKENEKVRGEIDIERRKQLAVHHTATHIVNGAAKKVLGRHVWQAGAAKTLEKARLDITHFDSLTEKETEEIEKAANEMIKKNSEIIKKVIGRGEAEAKYGFVLYQGGAVPGKNIRVVEIPGFDVEACGGTHLDRTGEAGAIKILKSSKLQDGIVRIEFAAGDAVKQTGKEEAGVLEEIAKKLGVKKEQVPARASELFEKWKNAKKNVKKKKQISKEELIMTSKEQFKGTNAEIIDETAKRLNTQVQHIENTIDRFLRELEEIKKNY